MPNLLVKKLFLLFSCCFITATLFSQQYPKYVVAFKNKKNSPYKLNKPAQYLSAKAIARRQKYNIKIDSSDLPVNPSYISQVVALGSVTYLGQSKWLNQVLIYTTSDAKIQAIKKLSFVKSVTAVGPASTTLGTESNKFKETITPAAESKMVQVNSVQANHYSYGNSYNQIHIHNGEFLHNKGFTGRGITIAIIDAGFYHYKTTIAFDSIRARNGFLGEKDFVDFDGSVDEDFYHGEFCLSAIAANVPGVMIGTAPDANFWLLRSENQNSEFPIEEHNWAAAAEFADSAGADMISSSLGYMQFDDAQFNHTYNDFYKNTTMASRAAMYAARKGIIVTNSAGNEGNSSWKYLIFPSDDDSICAVAATDTLRNIASFSSYGYQGKIKPNIASVGLNTALYASYGPTYGNGTSFSNPNINGLIACLWQAFPSFNNMQILDAVYRSSGRYTKPDNRFGYGMPDMKKAYNRLLSIQNEKLYGNEWLMVNQPNFSNEISFKLIGRRDTTTTIKLINEYDKTIASLIITTEEQEVYDKKINGLESLPSGIYKLMYNDGVNAQTIKLYKYPLPFASAPNNDIDVVKKSIAK